MAEAVRRLLRPSWDALRSQWRAFALIQACALAVVVLYYRWPALAASAEALEGVKKIGGLWFAAVSTVVASVLLPEIAKRAVDAEARWAAPDGSELGFQVAFFAWIGVQVDLFYRLQAFLFGTGADLQTVVTKLLFDQFVWSVVVTVPLVTLIFLFKQAGYSFRVWGAGLKGGTFGRAYPPMMALCWAFWVPALVAVYALPALLQFWMFLFLQAAYALIVVPVGNRSVH